MSLSFFGDTVEGGRFGDSFRYKKWLGKTISGFRGAAGGWGDQCDMGVVRVAF